MPARDSRFWSANRSLLLFFGVRIGLFCRLRRPLLTLAHPAISFGDYAVVLGGTGNSLRRAASMAEDGAKESLLEDSERAALMDQSGVSCACVVWVGVGVRVGVRTHTHTHTHTHMIICM